MAQDPKNRFSHIKEEFIQMQKAYEEDDKLREEIIILSRDIIKPSKQAIYSVHREQFDQAQQQLEHAREQIHKAKKRIEQSSFDYIGSFRAGLEEYVEAMLTFSFMKTGQILSKKDCELEFELPSETYIAAISDFTGELVRAGVRAAIAKNKKLITQIHQTIEELHGLTMGFNARSGDLRKKIDTIKYNLAKIENIVYDITIKQN
ncbi:MAG: translin family protein [Candidatus Nanoarchaeia archaeon]